MCNLCSLLITQNKVGDSNSVHQQCDFGQCAVFFVLKKAYSGRNVDNIHLLTTPANIDNIERFAVGPFYYSQPLSFAFKPFYGITFRRLSIQTTSIHSISCSLVPNATYLNSLFVLFLLCLNQLLLKWK